MKNTFTWNFKKSKQFSLHSFNLSLLESWSADNRTYNTTTAIAHNMVKIQQILNKGRVFFKKTPSLKITLG